MDYILKIPGPLADRVPFSIVASAVANAEVKGIEKGKTRDQSWERGYVLYLQRLLDAAQLGALKVCDSKGSPGSFDEIIDRASENYGMLEVLHPADQGGGVDEAQMRVTVLYSRLAHLNEWAAKNLDKFILSDESGPFCVHVDDDMQIPALRLTKLEKCSEPPIASAKKNPRGTDAFHAALDKLLTIIEDRAKANKINMDRWSLRGTKAHFFEFAYKHSWFPKYHDKTLKTYIRGTCKFKQHESPVYKTLFSEIYKK